MSKVLECGHTPSIYNKILVSTMEGVQQATGTQRVENYKSGCKEGQITAMPRYNASCMVVSATILRREGVWLNTGSEEFIPVQLLCQGDPLEVSTSTAKKLRNSRLRL